VTPSIFVYRANSGRDQQVAHSLQLVAEAQAGLAAAEESVKQAREHGLDATLSPDPKAAQATITDTEFARDRLKALVPKLWEHHRTSAQPSTRSSVMWLGSSIVFASRR
jgi:hypothetical protein